MYKASPQVTFFFSQKVSPQLLKAGLNEYPKIADDDGSKVPVAQ